MPKCFMNSVRGYKENNFWGCEADSRNVMLTRSGLMIRTTPASSRRLTRSASVDSELGSSYPPVQKSVVLNRQRGGEASQNQISVVTRYMLEQQGGARVARHLLGYRGTHDGANHVNTGCLVQARHPRDTKSFSVSEPDTKRTKYSDVQGASSGPISFHIDTRAAGDAEEKAAGATHTLQLPGARLPTYYKFGSLKEATDVASAAQVLLAMARTSSRERRETPGPVQPPAPTTRLCPADNPRMVTVVPYMNVINSSQLTNYLQRNPSDSAYDPPPRPTIPGTTAAQPVVAAPTTPASVRELSAGEQACHLYALDANGNHVHKCVRCGKVFTVLAAFLAHAATHQKTKNRCEVCGKHFTRSWLLKGHMRTHTGERPYHCQHPGCQKAFADKSNLRSHHLIHTANGKNYVCSRCNRGFAQRRYLHKHMLEVCKA